MQKVGNLEEETMQGPLEWYPSSGCLQLKWITPNQNRLQVQSNVPSQRTRLTVRMILVSKWRGDCLTGRESSGAVSQDWGRAPGTLSGLPRPSKGGRSLTGNWHQWNKIWKNIEIPSEGAKSGEKRSQSDLLPCHLLAEMSSSSPASPPSAGRLSRRVSGSSPWKLREGKLQRLQLTPETSSRWLSPPPGRWRSTWWWKGRRRRWWRRRWL